MLYELLSRLVLCILHADLPYAFPKPLTAAQEQECFEAMERGDIHARHRLTTHNLRLVAHIVKKYRGACLHRHIRAHEGGGDIRLP